MDQKRQPVNVVEVTAVEETWQLPLAAIFCIAIAAYVLVIMIGLSIRQCLLKKGFCESCQMISCCNCAEIGLRCAQACSCCGPMPSCSSLLDCCCPDKESCNCLSDNQCDSCFDCSTCASCWDDCSQNNCTQCSDCSSPSLCSPGALCDCQSCSCTCTTPECSTINCLCCEITIKGRGGQYDG
ncbi:uncharacterized protein LOC135220738 [Macrobrachium nipponense]|uniref:uncharacterized protein LOC135220738 n=1 Tax=Macrobrachium nipponense TaxID=159736 RepID=UPI0030C86E58